MPRGRIRVRDHVYGVRVSEAERQDIESGAEAAGMGITDFPCLACMEAARLALEAKEKGERAQRRQAANETR